MANKLAYVINASPVQFQLTNTINGVQQPGDAVKLPPNSLTKTGGKDNNFIQIPDATPPVKFFPSDNTNINAGSNNLYIYGTQGVVYWLLNSSPTSTNNGTEFPNSGSFGEGILVISQENGNWAMSLYDVNSI
jgi:hypothetical protein